MIKINLLPHAKRAKASDTEKQVVIFALVLFIITASLAGTGLWLRGKAGELEEQVREKESQRQLLLTRVARINQIEREFKEMESNIAAIKDIRLKQQLPVIYVDEAVRYVPGDRIWFEALNLSRQGVLDIRGVALDNQTFAMYVDELRSSPYVRSVSTQRTSRRQVMNLDLVEVQFQIRAGERRPLPAEEQHEN